MGLNQPSNRREISRGRKKNQEEPHSDSLYRREYISDDLTADSKLDSSSFIPRSILRTADRFRRELNSNLDTEEEVVEDFRNSRLRTRIAIRFLILLTIVPLLTQQISKHFVIGPIVDHFDRLSSATVGRVEQVINSEIETQILAELQRYEQKIRFQNLVKEAPLTAPDIEKKLKAKAIELADQFHWQLTEPLKNIISDGFGLAAFSLLVLTGQPQIGVVKSFLDEAIYGLSDSAKAFIIILFTDVFVGFHSPHGWGVVIHNTLQHFGLPQNENFIDMFIATFPVMLDTVFKYWIFRYLNQVSPSAVATYRNMNE